MATWKKVVVSGSNISQLNNDVGYLTTATVPGSPNVFATMSINGVNVLADSAVDILTFASASGAGLDIVGNPVNDTITFTLGSIPNASLANSTISGVSLGSNLADLTAGSGLTAAGTYNGGTARTFSVNSSSMATYFRQDAYSNVSGDITINSSGVAAIGTGVIVNADVSAIAAIDYTKINFGGSGFVSSSVLNTSATQGTVVNVINGVSQSAALLNLSTTGTPTFGGLTLTNGNVAINNGTSTAITTTGTTVAVFNANATTVNAFGAATTVTIGAGTGTTTIGNSLVVTGDLTVNGTLSYINTTDLFVEDKFILLASGSATAGDGGIVIDRGSDAAGNIAYGYDSATDRWGYQSGLTDATNALDTTSASGVSGSFAPYLFVEANHGAVKPETGEFAVAGAMYVSTGGDYWIYA